MMDGCAGRVYGLCRKKPETKGDEIAKQGKGRKSLSGYENHSTLRAEIRGRGGNKNGNGIAWNDLIEKRSVAMNSHASTVYQGEKGVRRVLKCSGAC